MESETDVAAQLAALRDRIRAIEARNERVAREKAWETSTTRKVSILLLTYFVMVCLFMALDSGDAFRNAIVPTMGFFLSTLSLPIIRKAWVRRFSGR
jgi:hypothetical protein